MFIFFIVNKDLLFTHPVKRRLQISRIFSSEVLNELFGWLKGNKGKSQSVSEVAQPFRLRASI